MPCGCSLTDAEEEEGDHVVERPVRQAEQGAEAVGETDGHAHTGQTEQGEVTTLLNLNIVFIHAHIRQNKYVILSDLVELAQHYVDVDEDN